MDSAKYKGTIKKLLPITTSTIITDFSPKQLLKAGDIFTPLCIALGIAHKALSITTDWLYQLSRKIQVAIWVTTIKENQNPW